ncbi:hypothetical protein H6P81_003202 [Aristolochia fimbriata]|uniref:Protein FAR1-RELATED SEQUENCE n=1 Tax=Aristolochia fimbriata TaxID=158543 RepID=A0AAV7FDR8_ARIFI|nr:hypothetical protein H6P81_003202 [Aristolochia fimbriata]
MKNQPSFHSNYLLKRWSKEAKSGLVVNHKGAAIEQDTRGPKLARYTQLMHNFVKIASLAAEHQTTFEVAREMSLQTMRHLEYTCKGIASVGPDGVPDVNNIEGQSNAGIVEQTGANIVALARRGKKQRGGSSLSRVKASIEKKGSKKQRGRTPHTQRALFEHKDTEHCPSTVEEVISQVRRGATDVMNYTQDSSTTCLLDDEPSGKEIHMAAGFVGQIGAREASAVFVDMIR